MPAAQRPPSPLESQHVWLVLDGTTLDAEDALEILGLDGAVGAAEAEESVSHRIFRCLSCRRWQVFDYANPHDPRYCDECDSALDLDCDYHDHDSCEHWLCGCQCHIWHVEYPSDIGWCGDGCGSDLALEEHARDCPGVAARRAAGFDTALEDWYWETPW